MAQQKLPRNPRESHGNEQTGQDGSRSRKVLPTVPLTQDDIDDFDGEVITMEPEGITDQQDTGARSPAGADATLTGEDLDGHHETRSMFGIGARARQAARQKLRREALDREALAASEGLDERDELRLLRMNSRLAAERYMQSLRDSNILVPGFNDAEREKKLSGTQQIYTKMMVMGALRPLTRGVDTDSVIQAMGAMTTMMLLSKNFRQEVGSYLEPIRDSLQARVDNKTRSVGAWADERVAMRNRLIEERTRTKIEKDPSLADDQRFMAHREGRLVERSAYLSKKWQRRLDDLERRDRGHRELYTAESAAMTEIGLTENAFLRLREANGSAPGQIMESYRAMMRTVRDQAAADGLDREEVARMSRTILGRRLEVEPELAAMYNGMAHGMYTRSAPHAERIAGSARTRRAWTGEFEDQFGRKIDGELMFTLRPKMGGDEHQAAVAEIMGKRLVHDLEKRGMAGFNEGFMGYMVGYAVAERNRTGEGEPIDASDLPEGIRARVAQSEQMMASMGTDGLGAKERQRVYSNAYVDAIEQVRQAYPEFARDWDQQFGATWQARMKSAVTDPKGFFAEQEASPRSWQTGSDGRARERETPGGRGYDRPSPGPGHDYQPA